MSDSTNHTRPPFRWTFQCLLVIISYDKKFIISRLLLLLLYIYQMINAPPFEFIEYPGTHADLLVVVFHKIITTGHQRLQPLFDCLLTILVNGESSSNDEWRSWFDWMYWQWCLYWLQVYVDSVSFSSPASFSTIRTDGESHGCPRGHLRSSSRLRSAMAMPSPSHLAPSTAGSSVAFLANQATEQSQFMGFPAHTQKKNNKSDFFFICQ